MAKAPVVSFRDTKLDTWFERDRAMLRLTDSETEQEDYFELWDEAVGEAIEDGFVDPKDFHRSVFDYAVELGMIIEGED